MPKTMLIDTNFSAAPIYQYLIQSGHEVFVIGGNTNDFLAKSVKNYINYDYSNVDGTREILEKLSIDYIVPGGNDRSYKVCAELNSKGRYHGIDTLETTETINNKEKFRTFATQIGLPIPNIISDDDAVKKRPLIVKPVDAYSGHGMTILKNYGQEDLESAISLAKEFSRSKTYIIEEYVEGQLYSHSAFIADGGIVADFIVEEHGTANPFVVDTSRVIYNFPIETLNRIRDSITLLTKKLNLVDGLIHTQFIKNGESFWLIEVTRRCPGDLYSKLIELSTGFNYAEMYARPFLGQSFDLNKIILKKSWVMRHTITLPAESILGSIHFKLPILIEKMVPISSAGDLIKASPFSRIALLFTRNNSEKELLDVFKKTLDRDLYDIYDDC